MLKNLKNRLNESKGFTLVELIVVIAIMVILIALLVPNVIGYIAQAQDTANLAAAKSIYNAANTACVNHKAKTGAFPTNVQLANLLNGYEAGATTASSVSYNGYTEGGKLVSVGAGTSAAVTYAGDGAVKYVAVCSNATFVSATTGANAANNLVCYDAASGKGIKLSSASGFASNLKCESGAWKV